MVQWAYVFKLEIRIGEIWTLLKTRAVTEENISILKYQRQAIAASFNWKDAIMLLPNNCCLLLSVGKLHPSGIKFLIGNFTGVPIFNFIPDSGSEMRIKS